MAVISEAKGPNRGGSIIKKAAMRVCYFHRLYLQKSEQHERLILFVVKVKAYNMVSYTERIDEIANS